MPEHSAKELILKPITDALAGAFIREYHYSGKCAVNSQLNVGVYWQGKLCGAMQLGPSLDKRKLIGLVKDTRWNEFIELNRLALNDDLPRNSESRALAVLFRILRKERPHIKWVVSFADGTQCGDGTIYRAAGFVLTGIKKSTELFKLPDGRVIHKIAVERVNTSKARDELRSSIGDQSVFGKSLLKRNGGVILQGFQLRYVYFIDPSCRARLTVPEIPFSKIAEAGAAMYKGKPRARSIENDTTAIQQERA